MAQSYHRVYIEISNQCNLSCSFCAKSKRPIQYLSTSQFTQIAEEVTPWSKEISLHVLGEPLMHPELMSILDICQKKQLQVNLTSNAILLEHFPTLYAHPALKQINFSMHAWAELADSANYQEVLKRWIQNAMINRPELYINLRFWTQSHLSHLQLPSFLKSDFFSFLEINLPFPLLPNGRKSRCLKGRLYLHFDTIFEWPSLQGKPLGERGKCHGLISQFAILSDGVVVPCCLDFEGINQLGNIFNTSLKNILQQPKSEQIKNEFHKGILTSPLCQRCSYCRRFNSKCHLPALPSA